MLSATGVAWAKMNALPTVDEVRRGWMRAWPTIVPDGAVSRPCAARAVERLQRAFREALGRAVCVENVFWSWRQFE